MFCVTRVFVLQRLTLGRVVRGDADVPWYPAQPRPRPIRVLSQLILSNPPDTNAGTLQSLPILYH